VGSVGRYNKITLPQGGNFSAQHIQANQYSVDLDTSSIFKNVKTVFQDLARPETLPATIEASG
jgi:hypothetical protein